MPTSYMFGKPVSYDVPDTVIDKGVSKEVVEQFRDELKLCARRK